MPVGISSYAYRYGIGLPGFRPAAPMSAIEFLREARRLDLCHAQLCENLDVASLGRTELERIREAASDLGLILEVGMRSLTAASLERHLEIAEALGSFFLRIVLGGGGELPEPDPGALADRSLAVLQSAWPRIRGAGLTVGIENHFDLETGRLVALVDALGSDRVGLVFDTTNGLGFLESPADTLRAIGRRLVSVHLKDYSVRKVEAGYSISGEILGEGMLDVDGTLDAVAAWKPDAPVLLEMTVRRREGQNPEEAVAWERGAVERSAARLHEAVRRRAASGAAERNIT